MSTKHTDGPWMVHPLDRRAVVGPDELAIADVHTWRDTDDARLIAATPDLLAKLVKARELLDDPRLRQSEWDLRKHDEPLVLFTRRIDEAIEANEALHRELREMDEVIARATETQS